MKQSLLGVAVLAAGLMTAGCTIAGVRIEPVGSGGTSTRAATSAVTSQPVAAMSKGSSSAGSGSIEPTGVAQSSPITAVGPGSKALHHPKIGSVERRAILDALRVPVRKELRQPVIFKISYLAVEKGWAFTYGQPLRANGKHIDYKITPYAKALADGFFDDNFSALLRYRSRAWTVVRYDIGATDVSWLGWEKKYAAPRGLFPLHE